MSDVVPIKMDISDFGIDEDDDTETQEAAAPPKRRLNVRLIGSGVAVALLMVALSTLLISGALPTIGAPKLANARVESADDEPSKAGLAEYGENDKSDDVDYSARSGATPARAKDDKKEKKSKDAPGEIKKYGDTYYFVLKPVAVTNRRGDIPASILITLAFETNKSSANALLEQAATIKEDVIAIMQAKETAALYSWDAADVVGGQVRRQLEEKFPELEIDAVLVQEFMVFQRTA